MARHQNNQTVILDARKSDDLDRQINRLAIDVPPRDEGRTSAATERWQIHHLLRALYDAGRLRTPLRLYRTESPDFILETRQQRIGIEVTEAVHPDYVRAQMMRSSPENRSEYIVDPSLFKWRTGRRSAQQIREAAFRTRLTGPGWVGDAVEDDFSQSIIDVVQRKHRKLLAGYQRFDQDELLIYHNQPTPCIDIGLALADVARRLATYWHQSGFRTVYVHKYDTMLCFRDGTSEILHEFARSDAPPGLDDDAWARLEPVEKIYLKTLEHESDFAYLMATTATEPLTECHHFDDDLSNLHADWLAGRILELRQRGYTALLQSPGRSRLMTLSEIADSAPAIALFNGCLLEAVAVAVRAVVDATGRSNRAVPTAGTLAHSVAIAVLRYLTTLKHMPQWARDADACYTVLSWLHRTNPRFAPAV